MDIKVEVREEVSRGVLSVEVKELPTEGVDSVVAWTFCIFGPFKTDVTGDWGLGRCTRGGGEGRMAC